MAINKDATVLILDVGRNAIERESDSGPTFFEEAKRCIEAIITRKLFMKPNDEMSLLMLGVPFTDNELNERHGRGYEHIAHGFPMKVVNWEMLNYINRSIDLPKDDVEGDWIDSIIVAMDYLRNLDIVKANRKIILFTNFLAKAGVSNVVGNALEQEGIELIVITTNVIYELSDLDKNENATFSQMQQKTKNRDKNECLIKKILCESNGVLCSFEDAMAKLIYLEKRTKRRVPWNAELTVGNQFSIKIAAYISLRNEKELNAWKKRAPDRGAKLSIKKCYFKQKDEELPNTDEVMEELIKGYLYGGQAVAFEDTDDFENSGKGLRFIGVTAVSCICEEFFAGTGIWLVGPQKGSQTSPLLLTALSKTLHKLNSALIARYTYSNKSAPKLMALFPNTSVDSTECEHNSLLMYELFFKDNFVETLFPSLENTEITQNESDIIDKFIDSMDLSGANTSNEDNAIGKSSSYFKKLLDPGLQHTFRAIAHRALNPSDPLLKPDNDILDMIKPPKEMETKPIVEHMKTLFTLEPVVKSKKDIFMASIENRKDNEEAPVSANVDNSKNNDKKIKEVSSIDPAEDFIILFNSGERFDKLVTQLQNVILQIVLKSMDLVVEKMVKAIFVYREFAKQKAPYKFNEWIANFKEVLDQHGKFDLWMQLVVNENLGLITSNESELSMVSEAEAQDFIRVKDTSASIASTSAIIDDDNDNLFDQM